ncbi:MAG: hypothetical protein FWG75_02065 [Cystobacterineae bacterium]|nr:hypothetical protein [Cystobacterineae bacterium]
MDEPMRYLRQRVLEGVGEAGQQLFFSTEVVCEGQSPALQTAAAYIEAAGFCLNRHAVPLHPGFCPVAWQEPKGVEPCSAPLPASAVRQRGFLGQLPCACPEGFDFWVLMGCWGGEPGFIFARQSQKPFLEARLRGSGVVLEEPSPVHFMMAAWAALVFEKLALGLLPEAGGGSISALGEVKLWEAY